MASRKENEMTRTLAAKNNARRAPMPGIKSASEEVKLRTSIIRQLAEQLLKECDKTESLPSFEGAVNLGSLGYEVQLALTAYQNRTK